MRAPEKYPYQLAILPMVSPYLRNPKKNAGIAALKFNRFLLCNAIGIIKKQK